MFELSTQQEAPEQQLSHVFSDMFSHVTMTTLAHLKMVVAEIKGLMFQNSKTHMDVNSRK